MYSKKMDRKNTWSRRTYFFALQFKMHTWRKKRVSGNKGSRELTLAAYHSTSGLFWTKTKWTCENTASHSPIQKWDNVILMEIYTKKILTFFFLFLTGYFLFTNHADYFGCSFTFPLFFFLEGWFLFLFLGFGEAEGGRVRDGNTRLL